ncbi:unnamed protein product [Chilo suppressalis]|uniref:PH domain-containing protein n=1 Tax=Chilo suppressalis TaxID=168631 RepID=A0ABN8AU04_CHISP|nr:unnamed protein product [Chilo suppressalis]
MIQKSASWQVYRNVNSTSSDISTSSSENNETPLKKFNRLFRTSVARRWAYFKRDRSSLWVRGRSVSDTELSIIINNERAFCDVQGFQRRSLQVYGARAEPPLPTLFVTSAGGSGSGSVACEEASDGSDAERPRRGHHLRVPTPAFPSQ